MSNSIVKVPKDSSADYDFIAFSFNGYHSWEDLSIVRVIDGDRYNEDLNPELEDIAVDNGMQDGQIYIGTYHRKRKFPIKFAFDNLNRDKLALVKRVFGDLQVHDLWFAEAPYKVYDARIAAPVTLRYIPFDENGQTVYKGEGTVEFVCDYPYAHTPDIVATYNTTTEDWTLHNNWRGGKSIDGYKFFYGYEQFKSNTRQGELSPYGNVPFTFVASLGNLNSAGQASIVDIVKDSSGQKQSFQFTPNSTGLSTLKINEIIVNSTRPAWQSVPQDDKNRIDTVIFDDSIEQIPEYAFQHFLNLKRIFFPASLSRLGSMFLAGMNSILTVGYGGAEYLSIKPGEVIDEDYNNYLILYDIKNRNLTNFTPHKQTKFVSSYACNQSALTEVHLENTQIVELAAGAFQDCHELKEIYLPSTMKFIERGALLNLNEDSVIHFSGTKEQWDEIAIDRSWGFTPKTLVIGEVRYDI